MRRDRGIQKDNTIGMVVVVVKLATYIEKYHASWLLISHIRTGNLLSTSYVEYRPFSLCNFDLLPFQFIAKEASILKRISVHLESISSTENPSRYMQHMPGTYIHDSIIE